MSGSTPTARHPGPTAVVVQPSYLPWRGFFHLVQRADVFVFYDDVQFDRSGWRNRNRIKTAQGSQWLTVPVLHKGHLASHRLLKDTRICWDTDWAAKHRRSFEQAYGRAPFFELYRPLLADILARHDELLVELTCAATVRLAEALGITGTRFLRSSELGVEGDRMEHLIGVLQRVEARHYISGPSARTYLDEGALARAGISLEYMTYHYPPYEQLHPPFDPQVSVLDLLFAKGPEAWRWIWGPAPGEP